MTISFTTTTTIIITRLWKDRETNSCTLLPSPKVHYRRNILTKQKISHTCQSH